MRRRISEETGVMSVLFAGAFVPIALAFFVLAVEAGNWFVHKRHLQTQADAAALAAAGSYRFPSCDDTAIRDTALAYSGVGSSAGKYNADYPKVDPSRLHAVINGGSFYGQSSPGDSIGSSPCTSGIIDVKMTETDLPYMVGSSLIGHLNAQARVSLFKLTSLKDTLPLAVIDPSPVAARAFIVNESNGATVASVPLTAKPSSGGLQRFGAPMTLPTTGTGTATDLGVRIALSGSKATTTCGDRFVKCYDSAVPNNGLSYLRVWDTTKTPAADEAPVVRSVRLNPGSCHSGSYNSGTACTATLTADVKFNPSVTPANTASRTVLKVSYNSSKYAMTYDPATAKWTSAAITLPAGAVGTSSFSIDWEQQVGKTPGGKNPQTCTTANNNPCKGTFDNVQRTFYNNASDDASRGGPIAELDVLDGPGGAPVSDLQRCTTTCPALYISLGLKAGLELDKLTDPPRQLRVSGSGSQNQTVDCDSGRDLVDEVAYGCRTTYGVNAGTACTPAATPPTCVPTQTGTAANKAAQGFNVRVLCAPAGNPGKCKGSTGSWDGKPTTCPAATAVGHNNWPNYSDADPRLVSVLITPFGSFDGSGTELVPITGFAAFYITGYGSNGGGFDNPCIGNGDQFAPNTTPDGGVVSGHFVKKVASNLDGAPTDACDLNQLGQCVAVLVK